MVKEIKITCKGAGVVGIWELENFQGGLKKLGEKEYRNLRKAMEDHGFSFPVFVWRDFKKRKNFIIDGHQRLVTLRRMLKEGYWIKSNQIPVDWIEAKNKKEAKEKVLMVMSQYGKYSQSSMGEYLDESGLDLKILEEKVDLPGIDFRKLLKESGEGEGRPEIEFTEELLEEHNYIVLYFTNEIDWLQAKTLFGLKTVKALDSKKGFEKMGIGRVLNGAEAIERLRRELR